MLGSGGWNTLHTHPGSTYSGTYFAADGGCCTAVADGTARRLSGRLAMLPAAPPTLSEHSLVHLSTCPYLSSRTPASAAAPPSWWEGPSTALTAPPVASLPTATDTAPPAPAAAHEAAAVAHEAAAAAHEAAAAAAHEAAAAAHEAAAAAPPHPAATTPSALATLPFLLHEPQPGTLHLFPSFVPHFVFPVGAAADGSLPSSPASNGS